MKNKKILVVVAIIAVLLVVGAVQEFLGGGEPQEQPDQDVAEQGIEEGTEDAEIPVIIGSNAYDITASLEELGIECERSESGAGGYYFNGSDGVHFITVETDSDYQVAYIRADLMGAEYDGFLGYVASFPREDGTSQESQNWANDNAGKDVTEEFGGATYTLEAVDGGMSMVVKAAGYDEYAMTVLESTTE